jgi:hypothetical protein
MLTRFLFICPFLIACTEQKIARLPEGVPADPPLDGAELALAFCARCHDPGDGSYAGSTMPVSGMAFAANLTPDSETGIGDWTDDQIRTAIVEGIDDQGEMLCPEMPRHTELSDSELAMLIDFLRQLPPVSMEVHASECEK